MKNKCLDILIIASILVVLSCIFTGAQYSFCETPSWDLGIPGKGEPKCVQGYECNLALKSESKIGENKFLLILPFSWKK